MFAEDKSTEDKAKIFQMLETIEKSKQPNTFDERWRDSNNFLPMSREELKMGTFSFSLLVKRAFVDGQQCLEEDAYQTRVKDVWDGLVQICKDSAASKNAGNEADETTKTDSENETEGSETKPTEDGEKDSSADPKSGDASKDP